MKNLSTILILVLSLSSFAKEVPKSLFCSPRSEGAKPAYDTTDNPFMDSSLMVKKADKPAYDLYNKNFGTVKSYMADECKTARDASSLIYKTSEYCYKKCEEGAPAYVSAFFDKKNQQEKIADDCRNICHKHWWEASQQIEGYRIRLNEEEDLCANQKTAPSSGSGSISGKESKGQNRQ